MVKPHEASVSVVYGRIMGKQKSGLLRISFLAGAGDPNRTDNLRFTIPTI